MSFVKLDMPYYTYSVSVVDENHPLFAHIPEWYAVHADPLEGEQHGGPDLAYFKNQQLAENHCQYMEVYQYEGVPA